MNTHSTTSNEGWIEWNGGECPLVDGAEHEVRFRDGGTSHADDASSWRWDHWGSDADIIAYRIVGQGK